jgi:hypothetical protein
VEKRDSNIRVGDKIKDYVVVSIEQEMAVGTTKIGQVRYGLKSTKTNDSLVLIATEEDIEAFTHLEGEDHE